VKALLEKLLDGGDLTEAEASELLVTLTGATLPEAITGAILAALRAKGETSEEIRGFAKAMRRLAVRPGLLGAEAAVDVVGTGGDGSGSLNLSTGAALLAAACGLPVVKHGNRAQSSRSGSADVLEALGYALPIDADQARESFEKTGFTFLFAPAFHPAMKALAPIRRALGVRTVFNLLGPLTNPAEPRFALIGAFSPSTAGLLAETLAGLPIERAFVIHGDPGWDEATPVGPFLLYDVRPGRIVRAKRDPADFGLARCAAEDLLGGEAHENARHLRRALAGENGPHLDALVLGAGLALEVAGGVATLADGIERAREAVASGAAIQLVERLADASLRGTVRHV
jgi:anthranilate phosphoribosyltransferase